jgi:hypothetical protein
MPSTITQQSDRRSRGNRRRPSGLGAQIRESEPAMPGAARGTASGRPFTVSVVPALEADGPLGEEDLAQFFSSGSASFSRVLQRLACGRSPHIWREVRGSLRLVSINGDDSLYPQRRRVAPLSSASFATQR